MLSLLQDLINAVDKIEKKLDKTHKLTDSEMLQLVACLGWAYVRILTLRSRLRDCNPNAYERAKQRIIADFNLDIE